LVRLNIERGKEMIKDNVRKECCLFLILALAVSLFFIRPVSVKGAVDLENDGSAYSAPEGEDLKDPFSENEMPESPVMPTNVPKINTTQLYLLFGGDAYELQVENAATTYYELAKSSQPVVALSNETAQSVTITPLAAGQTVLYVTAVGNDGVQTVLTCQITVSALTLSSENITLYMNDEDPSEEIRIEGVDLDAIYYGTGEEWEEVTLRDAMNTGTKCSIRPGNPKVADAYFSDGYIYIRGISKGVTNIRMQIYGVSRSVRVTVQHYTLNKYTINTYQGSGIKNLKLRGAGSHKVTWVSGNKNVASVSKTGIVSVKGIGTTKITAKVNGRKVVCIVSVSSKTAYRAIRDARAITKLKNIQYSQEKRMSKNYYDCSSLVYRCYRPYGIRFGYTHPTWAPTAADEARWCSSKRHLVAEKAVDLLSCKLIPGDTIYYSFNGNNGRYLDIDHTALFAGYAYDDEIGFYGTVIEASSSSNTVTERMYYASDSIRMIGRPSKI
ncbi:MAG: Ig-like domain-containing protein, partial [Eubacterium sp.]|nr:Ig-like domain-containing protein [Eubacterium sp.]